MRYRFQSADRIYELTLEHEGDHFLAQVDGQSYELEVLDEQNGQLSLRFQGHPVNLFWAVDGSQKWVSLAGCTYCLERPALRRANLTRGSGAGETGGEAVRSPMPAQVRAIQVSEGMRVEKGQTLLLLEAMKMEIRIKAPSSGRVTRLLVSENQAVEKDQLLAEIGE